MQPKPSGSAKLVQHSRAHGTRMKQAVLQVPVGTLPGSETEVHGWTMLRLS